MASPLPLQYNVYYHIYNRGNNRENIFIQERNYYHFMNLYDKYIAPIADTYAYCLLRNHFHLLVHIKSEQEIITTAKQVHLRHSSQENQGTPHHNKPSRSGYPSQQFANLFNAYAKSINYAYGRTGSLFQNPFGRVVITNNRQFLNVITYIHQNPQKHKLVEDFREWKWSSYDPLIPEKPTNINRETVLKWFGSEQEYINLHHQWISDSDAKWFAEGDDD